MIDLRLMQAAVTVAEERSVTRAADRLGLTQPALSKQLNDLEDRVGFILFKRSSQKFAITDAGAHFVEHARIAIAEMGRAVQAGRAAALGAENVLCIARAPNVDPFFLTLVRSVRLPLYPKLGLRMATHYTHEALRMLRSGDADVAITTAFQDQAGVSSNKLTTDNLFVVLSQSDQLSRKHELTLQDLQSRRMALPERQTNPAAYDRLEKVLSSNTLHFPEVHYFREAQEAAALILQAGCAALMTQYEAWRISGALLTSRPLREQNLQVSTYLSVRLDEQSQLVSDFVRAFRKRLMLEPARA